MKNFKFLILLVSVTAMLAACGEGFQAKTIDSINDEAAVDNAVEQAGNNVTGGETPLNVDQQILQSYASETLSMNAGEVKALADSIKAFEVSVTYNALAAAQINSVSATIETHCLTPPLSIINTSITDSRLRGSTAISLGRQSDYEVIVQCTSSACDEMVATIRSDRFSTERLIMVGLKKQGAPISAGGETTFKYVSRKVDIETWFASPIDVASYNKICDELFPISGVDDYINPNNSNGPFLPTKTGDSVDPTQGAFTPSTGTNQGSNTGFNDFDGTGSL